MKDASMPQVDAYGRPTFNFTVRLPKLKHLRIVDVSFANITLNEQLTPRAQAERDMARSRIAIFARTQEFGEVTVDELDMDPDLHEHMREWCGLKHPRTKVSLTYDVVQFVLLLYIVIWVPWRIAFETETTPDEFVFWWDIFIDVALVFDMFLCMHRYYFDEIHHKLITDPKLIRRAYL